MKFLQQDTFLTKFLARLIDIVIVSALWLLCSIPVITIGASTTAMYDMTLHMVFDDTSGIVYTFFTSFRKNFGRATAGFLFFIASGLFLAADLWSAVNWDTPFRMVLIFMILAASWFWMAAFTHAFAGLAWFEGKPFAVIRMTFLMAMRNGVYTMFIIILNALPIVFLVKNFTSGSFGQFLITYLLVGSGTVAYLSSLHLARLFAPEKMEEFMKDKEE